MGCFDVGLSGTAWCPVDNSVRHADLPALAALPLVVPIRSLCAGSVRQGRSAGQCQRFSRLRLGHCWFALARPAEAQCHHLWLFPLGRSEEHTSELQSLMRISYAVFCLKKKKLEQNTHNNTQL